MPLTLLRSLSDVLPAIHSSYTAHFRAQGFRPARRVEAELSAPPDSFSAPLYFPNATGFSDKPGCVESYSARVVVRAYEHDVLILTALLRFAALEFGGSFRCQNLRR